MIHWAHDTIWHDSLKLEDFKAESPIIADQHAAVKHKNLPGALTARHVLKGC
jgi:hypothetical protein